MTGVWYKIEQVEKSQKKDNVIIYNSDREKPVKKGYIELMISRAKWTPNEENWKLE